ncbi:hypothetical protein [Flavobacterium cerinum]|uniref:Outer membrane protein beta-barrel domain-containing protein n=1 Tax=Flavobacterium cerinum TaxID=2502784 RepID=A0ABY5IMK3_9FLAO|nr:hypothetical protein [Flavobacterium cerinum]UUC44078.1 hypothetical protein NOX80_10585 [Flavobacterium cerinum]
MQKLYFFFFTFLLSVIVYAQPSKGEFINVSMGFGLTSPYNETDTDMNSNGFYAQGEYIWSPRSWFGVRPYVGVVITSGEAKVKRAGAPDYKIQTNAALLGAKVRLAAPIPYVAPFIETGFGVSIGSFETFTEEENLKKSGIITHIPLTLGLAIGRKHNYEVKLIYYYQEQVRQVTGAAALGFSFPID